MRFIIDTQLPRALVRVFRESGHDATHVLDLGLAQSADRLIAAEANHHQAVIVTKDEDFVAFARNGVRVLWIRLGNCPNDELISALIPILPDACGRFEQGEFLVEVN